MVWLLNVEKTNDMYNCLDRISARDGQTDGQTSCHGIDGAMHTCRVVNTLKIKFGARVADLGLLSPCQHF